MKRALQEFVIEGVKTTIPFHIKLMDDPGFKSGIVGNSQSVYHKKVPPDDQEGLLHERNQQIL